MSYDPSERRVNVFFSRKDGGPESRVTGWFLIEMKSLFSVVLLRFSDGSRDAYHSHAFGAISWVLRGRLREYLLGSVSRPYQYTASALPVWTPRVRFHKVVSEGTTWVLSLRGPWAAEWFEYDPRTGQRTHLTHGRREVA